ncbi:MAG: hypothetical protein M3O31_09045 [Acidobacteriota bacterium]|nr:hypothetical protein [Acidobacteriota bacterium]
MLNAHSSIDHSSSAALDGSLHSILLVDHDPDLGGTRQFLLAALNLPVEAVGCSLEVFGLRPESDYGLVAINLSVGLSEASHVATYVRYRWPDAKILLLGESCKSLDDPLYDDRVNPFCDPSALADASKRLLAAA